MSSARRLPGRPGRGALDPMSVVTNWCRTHGIRAIGSSSTGRDPTRSAPGRTGTPVSSAGSTTCSSGRAPPGEDAAWAGSAARRPSPPFKRRHAASDQTSASARLAPSPSCGLMACAASPTRTIPERPRILNRRPHHDVPVPRGQHWTRHRPESPAAARAHPRTGRARATHSSPPVPGHRSGHVPASDRPEDRRLGDPSAGCRGSPGCPGSAGSEFCRDAIGIGHDPPDRPVRIANVLVRQAADLPDPRTRAIGSDDQVERPDLLVSWQAAAITVAAGPSLPLRSGSGSPQPDRAPSSSNSAPRWTPQP